MSPDFGILDRDCRLFLSISPLRAFLQIRMSPDRIHIRATWKRFRQVVNLLLKSPDHGRKAMVCAASMVGLIFAINGLNVFNSYVGRYFMSAIERRQMLMFERYALYYVLVFVTSTVVVVLYRYVEEYFGILWREQLTRELTNRYLNNRTYHRLDTSSGIANPDQRISDDVRAFTTTTLSFTLLIVNGSVTAVLFSGVLWSISPRLFIVAVIYASGGTVMAILLGKPLIGLNYNQLDMEANFRSDLIHVRENSESIALAHREGRFRARLGKRLDALVANYRKIIRTNRALGFFTNGYNYFIQIIPALIIAPMFIAGNEEFGVITQSAMAFATLLGSFSLIVTQFQSISAFTAVTARLHSLSDAIVKAHALPPCSITTEETGDRVVFTDVTLRSADKTRLLIADLDLEIQRGSRWLVTAKDDAQKVAMFRATAGVWECGNGSVLRPDLDDILFLPERPYMPPGTLREVLLRTGMEAVTSDETIHEALAKLGIDDIVARSGGLDSEQDWDDLFSIGEQHLVSVARIFLAKPCFVFLDRPGSSLPSKQISKILDELRSQNTGVVIFAKNGESHLHYDAHLDIRSDGSWEVLGERGAVSLSNPAA